MSMIQSHFEINVSKNGSHYFATEERSLTTSGKARLMLADFRKRFPESEGFLVSVTEINCSGRDMTNLLGGRIPQIDETVIMYTPREPGKGAHKETGKIFSIGLGLVDLNVGVQILKPGANPRKKVHAALTTNTVVRYHTEDLRWDEANQAWTVTNE